ERFYPPPAARPGTGSALSACSHGSAPQGIQECGLSRVPDRSGLYQGFPAPDAGLSSPCYARSTVPGSSTRCSHVPRSPQRTSATSFSASAVLLRLSLLPLPAFSLRRSYASALRLRPARRPFRRVLSEWLSFASSDSTRAGISPSAFSRGYECASQPAADRFPIPSSPSDIPDVRSRRTSLIRTVCPRVSAACARRWYQPDV